MDNFNMDHLSTKFWDTIYRQNIAKMTGICYRYTQNRQIAEDLAHQAFLIAIDKSSGFENRGPFEAWLRRIVVNVSLQWLRDQKKQQLFEKSIAYNSVYSDVPEDTINGDWAAISKAELLEAINFLPDQHRLVFNLYVIDNFTHAQIGSQLGIPEGTSKSHLARARKKIRELLLNTLQKNKKQKKGFLLFLQYKIWNTDAFFSKKLKDLAIQPQALHSRGIADFNTTTFNSKITGVQHYNRYSQLLTPVTTVVISIVAISVLYFNISRKNKSAATYYPKVATIFGSMNNSQINLPLPDTLPATIPADRIISVEQNKKSAKMKRLIPASALLISSFALDTSALSSQLPLDLSSQKQKYNVPEQKKVDIPAPREPMHGTIYASKLLWSAANYAIQISGDRVNVNLNTQHFKGSGSFSFIDDIHLVVVDGTPIKLNETIKLADKTYTFNQLTEADATRKYGDKGKLGAVEIAVSE